MDILINVSKQRLKLATNLKKYVSGSQEFVRFVFGLNSYWRDLLTFAQFAQNGNTYNRYLDDENAVYLPSEIVAGECTLTLFGSGNNVIATTNYLTLTIDENILVSDASSTDISESLYEQLVDMVRSVSNGTAVVDATNKMTDKNKIYVYIGSETGMTNGNWYYWNGTVWTSGGVWNAVAVETDKTLSVEDKAADGKAAGSLVEVGSTQPTSSANKIWIDPTDEEIEIPEMSDLNAVDAKVDDLKSDLQEASIFDLTDFADHSTRISAGITYTYNGNNEWSVSGTLSGTSFCPLFSSSSKTAPFVAGKNYKVWFTSTSSNIYLQLYKYVESTLTLVENIYSKVGFQSVSFPADATGIVLRIRTSASVSNVTVMAYIYEDNAVFNKLSLIDADLCTKIGYARALTHSNDLDAITDVGVYAYSNSDKPSNAPAEESNAVLTVLKGFHLQGFLVQLCSTYTGKLFQRLQYTNGTWTSWFEISKGGTTIQNTYDITTSPTITTDSNGWLQAIDTDTSDETGKTDMTGAIMSMLTDTGYCHLGEGIFYVSGSIDMPDGSMLCGCGKNTVIRLLQSTTTGYCVKIGKYCTIKNLSFEGARTFAVPDTKGNRNGIAFMADYDSSPSVQTEHCMVDNVWLKFFSGAGIYCHNTSINYAKGVYVSNAFVYACYTGIDIDYYSEFNKFVNVCTAWCKYGCVNNGGNNVFTSCTFHATSTGFYIDGSQPNSAHGTLSGCTFCHIGSNQGKAVEIVGATSGFIINACQVWYNSIYLTNSKGIIISNCEFGRGTTIVISGGDTIMFVGNVFMDDLNYTPDISITDNTKVKFVNCYGGSSGNAISA